MSKLILLALFLVLIYGCEDDPIRTGPPQILSISPDEPEIGDTISISGTNFGLPGENAFLLYNSTLKVKSADCAKWNDRLVKLAIAPGMNLNSIAVVNSDTSNTVSVDIRAYPVIETLEIPSGSFNMGSERGQMDEKPVRNVTITKPFLISKYEITNQQYYAVTGNISEDDLRDFPVDSISWMKAVQFCNEISKLQGLDTCYEINGNAVIWESGNDGWRLPTEAEWEYACRAGSDFDISGTGNIEEMGWYDANSGFNPHSIGRKMPNDFDIYDMHGNVWEWCWDNYSDNYYSLGEDIDPKGPSGGFRRVARGGAYDSGNSLVRSSNRNYNLSYIYATGIRLVRNK